MTVFFHQGPQITTPRPLYEHLMEAVEADNAEVYNVDAGDVRE